MPETILVCEDDPVQRKMIVLLLTRKLGYLVIEAETGREALTRIDTSNVGDIHAVLLDIGMPGMDGHETLRHIRKHRPDLPVLMLTAQEDTKSAIKAFKAGASDFIIKPPVVMQLDVALKNAIRMSTLSRELTRLKKDKEGALGFDNLIGYDGGLADAIAYGRKAAASDIAVLITGETSTGKELLARAIHGESRRVGASFIAINCSVIPQHAIESILFGHEKGAVAGAIARSIGRLREAERGTVFLDDIHLLPRDAQVKLLRVLQEREIEPVGASKPVKVNIRVISATDHDLRAEVHAGRFREDLYFRLNVLTIDMPSLRSRQEDILPMVEYFIRRISSMDGLPVKTLAADAKRYLKEYAWPGNVRELEGLVHRALVLCEDEVIDRDLLMQIHDKNTSGKLPSVSSGKNINIMQHDGLFKSMEQIECEVMQVALEHFGQNITRAAEALGIAKSTFYRKRKNTL
jgi:DNA-binding NtrC family response regulator